MKRVLLSGIVVQTGGFVKPPPCLFLEWCWLGVGSVGETTDGAELWVTRGELPVEMFLCATAAK